MRKGRLAVHCVVMCQEVETLRKTLTLTLDLCWGDGDYISGRSVPRNESSCYSHAIEQNAEYETTPLRREQDGRFRPWPSSWKEVVQGVDVDGYIPPTRSRDSN
jgi:hypothetical protein